MSSKQSSYITHEHGTTILHNPNVQKKKTITPTVEKFHVSDQARQLSQIDKGECNLPVITGTFSIQFAQARKTKFGTQQELAKALNVIPQRIALFEKPGSIVSPADLITLGRVRTLLGAAGSQIPSLKMSKTTPID
jgi:hypothetical protein